MLSTNFRVLPPISQATGPSACTCVNTKSRTLQPGSPPGLQKGDSSWQVRSNKNQGNGCGLFSFPWKALSKIKTPIHSNTFYRSPGCFVKIELLFLKPAFSPRASALVNDCQAGRVSQYHVTHTRDLESLRFSFVSEEKEHVCHCTDSLCCWSSEGDSGTVTPPAASLGPTPSVKPAGSPQSVQRGDF